MIDEQQLFDRFHAALDVEPRAGMRERIRAQLVSAGTNYQRWTGRPWTVWPVPPRSWARVFFRLPQGGQRFIAGIAIAALAIASVGAFIVLNQYVHRAVPATGPVHIALCASDCQVITLPALPAQTDLPSPSAFVNCVPACDVTAFFSTSQVGWVSETVNYGFESFLYRTDDAGQHWRPVLSWMGSGAQLIRTSADGSEALVFSADAKTAFHTVDGGASWSSYGLPLGVPWWTFLSPREGWIFTNQSELLHTTDSGAHWFRLGTLTAALNHTTTSLTFTDPLTGYLVLGPASIRASTMPTEWNLLVTHDGGITWKVHSLPRPGGLSSGVEIGTATLQFFSPLKGVLELDYTDGAFASTTSDGGNHWTPPLRLPEYASLPGFGRSVFVDIDHWFRIVDDGIPWLIDYTSDGGRHWRQLASTPQGGPVSTTSELWKGFRSLDFVDVTHGWGISGGPGDPAFYLWITTDGGLTWSRMNLPGSG